MTPGCASTRFARKAPAQLSIGSRRRRASEAKREEGEIAPVEIEIWPSSTRFAKGEKLRLIVQGSDIYYYPGGWPTNAHESGVNKGEHVIHAGGQYDSHLLVPVIPAK